MKVQKHVNVAISSSWYRCSRVIFEGDLAEWRLSRSGRYDLLGAYERKPHRQLVEADGDDALRAFIQAWGPLKSIAMKTWEGSDPIANYRRERDTLRAWVRLLTSIENPEYLNDSIRDVLLQLQEGSLIWIRHRLDISGSLQAGFDDDFGKRLAEATQRELEDISSYLVGLFPLLTFSHFAIDRTNKRCRVRATSGIDSLTTALYWMVWQDYFMGSPWQFCEECHKLFQPDFHHKRKFCDKACAHRKAARKSGQRKRDKAKKAAKASGQRKRKREKINNGTQKAR